MRDKPNVNSASEKELDNVEKQFKEYSDNLEQMTLDRMNHAPKLEKEQQTKMSQKDMEKAKEIYLKPNRTISSPEPFNEIWREEFNFAKEYVYFIAENHEVIGEEIIAWTKQYPGQPAEEWKVPVNTPVWGPRYLAEQLKRCCYHRFTMKQTRTTGADHNGEYYGAMAVDTTVQRLDARPASTQKSVFMGAANF